MSIYRAEKGSQRVALNEWKSKNEQSISTTENHLFNSVLERKDGALLRSETKIKSKWDTYRNEDLLSDRISLVQEWLRNLKHSLQATEKEKMVLMEVKTYLEGYLNEALLPPLDVVAQCLYLRDQRHPNELTIDPVTAQLKDELHTYEVHKSNLAALDGEAWRMKGQLSALIEVLQFNISEQTVAQDLDVSMLALKISSHGLALRPEPQRVPTPSSAPDSWLSHCKGLVERQSRECTQSRVLRESMLMAIEVARNGNKAQQEDASKSFRERIHEIKIAIGRLKRQREQIMEEMEKVNQEIHRLEDADTSLDLPRALCETRHEGRTARPAGHQRCQDDPQDELAMESIKLADHQRKLQQNTYQARTAYESLRVHLAKVEFDLEDKNAALALEIRCLSSREQLEKSDYQVVQSHSSQL